MTLFSLFPKDDFLMWEIILVFSRSLSLSLCLCLSFSLSQCVCLCPSLYLPLLSHSLLLFLSLSPCVSHSISLYIHISFLYSMINLILLNFYPSSHFTVSFIFLIFFQLVKWSTAPLRRSQILFILLTVTSSCTTKLPIRLVARSSEERNIKRNI